MPARRNPRAVPARRSSATAFERLPQLVPLLLLATSALLIYAPRVAPPSFASLRNWGFHFPLYVPALLALAFWVGAFLTLLPSGGRLLRAGAAAWGRAIAAPHDAAPLRGWGSLLFPALLLLLCWLLRSKYALLGDNWLRLEQAAEGTQLPWKWGVMFVSHQAIEWGERLCDLRAGTTLALFNSLASLPYAVAATSLARSLGGDAPRRGLVHLALLGLGGVQLFCGYLEVYSWTFAAGAVYLAVLMKPAGWGRLIQAAIVLAIGTVLHAIALLFLPSLLLYAGVLWRARHGPVGRSASENSEGRRAVPGALPAAGLALGIILTLLGAAALPLVSGGLMHAYTTAGPGGLTLLSPALVWERVNGLVLASPLGALLGVPAILWVGVRAIVRRATLPDRALILLAAALPVTLVLGMMKMVLGAADWDILSFAGLPLCLWAFAAQEQMAGGQEAPPAARAAARPAASPERPAGRASHDPGTRLLVVLVFLSLCNSWGFVLVNSSARSIDRLTDILRDDPAPYFEDHPPPLHVALTLRANRMLPEAAAVLREGLAGYPEDPRLAYNLAGILYQQGELEEARGYAETAVLARPGYVPPIHLIYLIDGRRGDRHGQYVAGRAILEIEGRQPELIGGFLSAREIEQIRAKVAELEPDAQTPDR